MENSSKCIENGDEQKRLKSVKQKIKLYQQQKQLIKEALSKLDETTPKKKIIFELEEDKNNYSSDNLGVSEEKKQKLFDSDDEEDLNFKLKNQFDGHVGEELYKLQSKFKGDERFQIDSRFVEGSENKKKTEMSTDVSIDEEKKHEIDILENILNRSIKPKEDFQKNSTEMLRFDPTQIHHLQQFEVTQPTKPKKTKEKRKVIENDQEMTTENSKPIVSKDTYYKVSDVFKTNLESENGFSLLNMYNRTEVEAEDENVNFDSEYQTIELKYKSKLPLDSNPFKYDSSEDEMEEKEHNLSENQISKKETTKADFLLEPFFFKENDYRFQEGADFINRIASENNSEFAERRRNLKNIIRAKVKNVAQKKNPFKRKLGANQKKKQLGIKKALNR